MIEHHKFKTLIILLQICFLIVLSACSSQQSVSNTRLATPSAEPSFSLTNQSPLANPGLSTSPVMTSTKTPPQDWEYRWLKGVPCKPPCWEGITPGVTTASQAVDILKQNNLISYLAIKTPTLRPEYGYVIWDWSTHPKNVTDPIGVGGDALYDTQTSTQVIYIIRPNFRVAFSFDEILKVFGNPSHVLATARQTPDGGVEYNFSIVYLDLGILAETGVATKDGSRKPNLSANFLLERVYFFAAGLQGFVNAYKQEKANFLISWQGFKDFNFYCRDPYKVELGNCSQVPGYKP